MNASNLIQQIADTVGVHRSTVLRILRGDLEYRRPSYVQRAERVRELAARYGYRPNTAARAVAEQRFRAVAFLNHRDRQFSHLPSPLIDGVQDALDAAGLGLLLTRCSDTDLADPGYAPKVLRECCVDGLLVNVNALPNPRLYDLLDRPDTPSLWLNIRAGRNCICPDDRAAARSLTEALIARGHQRIGYLGFGTVRHYSKAERPAGYRDAMEAAGLEPCAITGPPGSIAGGGRALLASAMTTLATGPGPAVWIGYSTFECIQVLHLAQAQGLRLGEDLLLASFVDKPGGGNRMLCAEAVAPSYDLGRTGVDALVRRIAGELEQPEIALPWTITTDIEPHPNWA
ncbi:MAG: LacI family DNA-binding transcriptional regulator [Planctomycetota bacterium]|jgi:LacI family transcriptional regulator|nr:LacI family DNA-binding transcriptional regulator [Planctomycetota bacterium]